MSDHFTLACNDEQIQPHEVILSDILKTAFPYSTCFASFHSFASYHTSLRIASRGWICSSLHARVTSKKSVLPLGSLNASLILFSKLFHLSQNSSVRWNNFENNISEGFKEPRDRKDFFVICRFLGGLMIVSFVSFFPWLKFPFFCKN